MRPPVDFVTRLETFARPSVALVVLIPIDSGSRVWKLFPPSNRNNSVLDEVETSIWVSTLPIRQDGAGK